MQSNEKERPGVIIGYKGVKYGLQKRKATTAPKPAAFGDDSSDDEAVDVQVARQQQHISTASKVEAARAAAVAEDSTVYEYDALYDDMQRNRQAPKKQDVELRKPKYIEALIQKAEIRKKEQDIAYERRMLKERKQDDHLYEEKEAFLTAAYKQKLIEDKYWIEREKRMDAVEAAEDVTKKSDLAGFYQNLLTKNVAFASNRAAEGGPIAEPEPSPIPDTLPRESEPAVADPNPPFVKSSPERERETAPEQDPVAGSATEEVEKKPEDRRKRRHDESSIASARERYLARKRQSRSTQPPSQ